MLHDSRVQAMLEPEPGQPEQTREACLDASWLSAALRSLACSACFTRCTFQPWCDLGCTNEAARMRLWCHQSGTSPACIVVSWLRIQGICMHASGMLVKCPATMLSVPGSNLRGQCSPRQLWSACIGLVSVGTRCCSLSLHSDALLRTKALFPAHEPVPTLVEPRSIWQKSRHGRACTPGQ